ncbi:hypothetical protein [Shewanella sp. 10N.286.54.B9]|uniref:hypothetical protein n=1 Tax=Shewanella sp. 10N.286.54.B9 TaxID=3229719 RepID=UPI00354F6D07
MKSFIIFSAFFFTSLSYGCDDIKTAHSNLLSSNFIMKQMFLLTVDDEKQATGTNLIHYANGQSKYEQLDLWMSEGTSYDADGYEPFMSQSFSCDDIAQQGDDVFINEVKDDKTYNTRYRRQENMLVPVETVMETEAGILFMSFAIKMVFDYSNFSLVKD